ncbi:hypothetical protein JL722_14308 [Aureococcus anophagefferens]|nr:hypothetical protein JL722_14308 [Aureococcus anophagefferens]
MVYLKKGTLASLRADMRDADARAARRWADAVAAAKRRAERRLKALAGGGRAGRGGGGREARRGPRGRARRGGAAPRRRAGGEAPPRATSSGPGPSAAAPRKAVAAAKADAARALVGRRLAAVYRGAKGARDVEAVRDEMRTIVGWASKPHATVAALDVALGQAYLRAVAVSATTKTLLDCESRAAVLEAERQTDAATGGFTGALDAFRGEVYDVIDKSARIATLVAAEFRRQKHARAFRACAARSRPFADFLETNELLVVAKAVRLRKKGLFSTTEVDATAVVSSRGAVRVVVMRAVVGDCDRWPRDGVSPRAAGRRLLRGGRPRPRGRPGRRALPRCRRPPRRREAACRCASSTTRRARRGLAASRAPSGPPTSAASRPSRSSPSRASEGRRQAKAAFPIKTRRRAARARLLAA